MPTWRGLKTWSGALVTVQDMQHHVTDNSEYLLKEQVIGSDYQGGNLSTTSVAWVDVDGAGTTFDRTVTTQGGPIRVTMSGRVMGDSALWVYFALMMNGTILGDVSNAGLIGINVGSNAASFALTYETTQPAGTYTIKPIWHVTPVTGTTATLVASVGNGLFRFVVTAK